MLVIGGGLVGSALATALASHPLAKGMSVMIVDPDPPATDKWPALSLRTSTITPSSKEFLEEIGVWSRIPNTRIAPFDSMFVWDHPAPLPHSGIYNDLSKTPAGTILFDAADAGEEVLGYVVDNETLRNAMYRCMCDLAASGGRELHKAQGMVYSINYGDEDVDVGAERSDKGNESAADSALTGGEDHVPWPVVELDNGEKIRCRLVAACDGSRSRVRTLAGADWFSHGYDQSAVVANVTLRDPIQTAYQRFVSTGPVAVLPVSTDDIAAPTGNVIWTTTKVEAEALYEADDAVFLNELNIVLTADEDNTVDDNHTNVFDLNGENISRRADVPLWDVMGKGLQAVLPRLGISDGLHGASPYAEPPACTGVLGRRGRFPLSLGHAPRYVIEEKRTVLVGDAAHSVHPLAGQGVNLGFADVQSLADCVASAAGTGRDVGGERGAPLMRFQRERMVGNVGMMGVLHSVQSVFDRNSPTGFRELRRAGMSVVNAIGPVKRLILRAMR